MPESKHNLQMTNLVLDHTLFTQNALYYKTTLTLSEILFSEVPGENIVAPGATRFLVLHMVNLTWRETASSNPARGTRLKNGPWIQPFAVLPE